MARSASRLIIEGRVQGVGYRWWALQAARRLGLAGWVRNRLDGSVEILAIGNPHDLDELADVCRLGPPAAAVASVRTEPADDDDSDSFAQRGTA